MVERRIYAARLDDAHWLSDQTRHLYFRVPEIDRFDFIAGQFVSMQAPHHDGKTVTRAYSIASAPRPDNTFDVCLNRVDGGFFSNLLCDLELGRVVKFHGPHGHFVMREPPRDSLLIGTGTGIAPLRGMLEWLFADPSRYEGRRFWLIYGTRHEKDIYYQEQFEQYAREHPQEFQYIITISRPKETWTGRKGYVQDRIREVLADYPDQGRGHMDTYICGLKDMVVGTRQMLIEEFGWDKKTVMFERFD
jgi:ferredoxin-NADP reductase